MRTDADRIDDILAAIAKIRERVPNSAAEFHDNELLQVWVIHHLQVLGEAARGVSAELRGQFPEVPWAQTIALRNILVHEDFGLNMHQVWVMAQKDMPALEPKVATIQARLTSGSESEG